MVRLQPLSIILWFSILAVVTPFLVPHHASQQCRVAKQNTSYDGSSCNVSQQCRVANLNTSYKSNANKHTLYNDGSLILHANQQQSTAETKEEEKELTPPIIAEMIEVSFLNSCLQLSQGYVDVLKLFIVAVKAGYELFIPLSELNQLVEDCPVNSAGRDLMKEEKTLRVNWMKVVYELLNALNPDTNVDSTTNDCDEVSDKRIYQVVQAMLDIKKDKENEEIKTGGEQDATVAISNLTVEQALECNSILSELNDSISDPKDKAFFTNDIRVALMTFRVLSEEELCLEGSAGNTNSVPRPPIPGTN